MVLTTTGRRSGLTRRTAIEFHEYMGQRYVFSAWGKRADWFRNIEANPHVTIQTCRGTESVLARRITSDLELAEAFEFALSNPTMRTVLKAIGFDMTLGQFIAQKAHLTFVTFDPTDKPTPGPLHVDLWWVWLLVIPICVSLGMLLF
jgi:deazaflavin-dependent oxidoreductase (nitroreductase family)